MTARGGALGGLKSLLYPGRYLKLEFCRVIVHRKRPFGKQPREFKQASRYLQPLAHLKPSVNIFLVTLCVFVNITVQKNFLGHLGIHTFSH